MAYEFIEGMFQIANLLLSIIAIIFVVPILKYYTTSELKPWKYVLFGLIVFDALLIIAGLRSFGVYENQYLTHVLALVILLVLIYAQRQQIKAWEAHA